MTLRNIGRVLKSEIVENICNLTAFIGVISAKDGNFLAVICFSNKLWDLISRNSSSSRSSSTDVLRKSARVRRASCSLLWCTSHRGEKGIKIIPTSSTRAGANWSARGTSQAASDCVSPVPPMKFCEQFRIGELESLSNGNLQSRNQSRS